MCVSHIWYAYRFTVTKQLYRRKKMAKTTKPRKRKSTDVFFRKKILPMKTELKDSLDQYKNVTSDLSKLTMYFRVSANLVRELMKPTPSEFYGAMPEGYPELTKEDLDHADLHLYGFIQTQNACIRSLKDVDANQVEALRQAYILITETHKNRKDNPEAYQKMRKDWDMIEAEVSAKMIEFASVIEPIGNMMGLVDVLKEAFYQNENLKKRWELFAPIHDEYAKKIQKEHEDSIKWFDEVELANEDEVIARWEPIREELHARLEAYILSQPGAVNVEQVVQSESAEDVVDVEDIDEAEIVEPENGEKDE